MKEHTPGQRTDQTIDRRTGRTNRTWGNLGRCLLACDTGGLGGSGIDGPTCYVDAALDSLCRWYSRCLLTYPLASKEKILLMCSSKG